MSDNQLIGTIGSPQRKNYMVLDKDQYDIITSIGMLIHQSTSHDMLRVADAEFQSKKKKLPLVVAVRLYQAMKIKQTEIT